jgi:hypothetical protein
LSQRRSGGRPAAEPILRALLARLVRRLQIVLNAALALLARELEDLLPS